MRMLPCWAGTGTVGSILSLPHSIKLTVMSRVDMWQLQTLHPSDLRHPREPGYHSLDAQPW